MKDQNKTKAQLIEELEALRGRLKEMEAKESDCSPDKGYTFPMAADRPTRRNIRTHIEFIADFDVIEATGINISDGGICFETGEDLPFEMRFDLDGNIHYHRAHLVWLERVPEGGYRFGLMFVRQPSQMDGF